MLILASQSPTRKALLAGTGLAFESRAAQIDERAVETAARSSGTASDDVAMLLAEAKACAVAAAAPGAIVIGADQTLSLDGELLHKSADAEALRNQLGRLRGRTHRLTAAVALAKDETLLWSHSETADLTMGAFTDAERDSVFCLEGEAVFGSVGGYRLEGPSIRLFESIRGDYFAILGLPLLPLLTALRRYAPDVFEARQ